MGFLRLVDSPARRRIPGSRAARLLTVLAFLATLLVMPTGSSAAGAPHSITISPDGLHAMPRSTPTWTVTVYDQSGQAIPNQGHLAWKVDGINQKNTTRLDPLGIITDINGQIQISYTGNASTGSDRITVFVDMDDDGELDQSEVSATTTVAWLRPTTVTIDPAAVTRTIQLSDVAGYGLETVHVTDRTGTGLFGVPVDITITGPNPLRVGGTVTDTGTVTTDFTGTGYFYDVGHIAGIDTITADVDGVPIATATAQWIHGPGVLLASTSSDNPVPTNTPLLLSISLRDTTSAVPGVPIVIKITGKNAIQDTVTTDADGLASYKYTSTAEGQDTVLIYADFDRSGTFSSGEPSNTLHIQWSGTATPPAASTLTLAPSTQSLTVGDQATVGATLSGGDDANSGVAIVYDISGVNSASGSATTDADGNASISYTGSSAGSDTVSTFADFNGDGSQNADEPSATATIDWSTGSVTPPPVDNAAAIAASQPAQPQAGCTYFAETQHNMCGDFAKYWNAFGGLAIYGFPITEPFQENGITVQYYERARFEAHPGTDDAKFNVLLGLVGNEVTAGRSNEAPFQPTTAKSGDCTFYAATGHNLCSGFQAYWEKYGGLAVYGYPISEEFQEVNPDTGQTYTVQYFERGRYEWHPGEWPERFDVELGRLGAQVFSTTYGVEYH